jgi:hypothetical protein
MTSETSAVVVTNIPEVLEWKVNYYNERMYRNEHFTSGTTDNNIKKLMDIEDLMALQQFDDAKEELDNWNINDDIIIDYKTVYSLALKKHLDLGDTLALDSEDVVTLRTIAHKDPIYTSPAAYAARAMLWDETFEEKIEKTGIIWLKSSKQKEGKKGTMQGKGWEIYQPSRTFEENLKLFNNIHELYKLEHPDPKPYIHEFVTEIQIGSMD